ncbi:hypothetical protein FGG12_28410, partial [Cupriavidus campinensis]
MAASSPPPNASAAVRMDTATRRRPFDSMFLRLFLVMAAIMVAVHVLGVTVIEGLFPRPGSARWEERMREAASEAAAAGKPFRRLEPPQRGPRFEEDDDAGEGGPSGDRGMFRPGDPDRRGGGGGGPPPPPPPPSRGPRPPPPPATTAAIVRRARAGCARWTARSCLPR